MRYITEQQVVDMLPMPQSHRTGGQAFRQLADGTAINHPRRRVVLPTGSVLHYMAAGNPEYFGIKVYSTNPKTGAHFAVPALSIRRRNAAGDDRSQSSGPDPNRRGQRGGHQIPGAGRCRSVWA